MASPFYLFRKYQKTFLVIAGVLAMFIFVLADPLMSWIQSSAGGGGGPRSGKMVVASWDSGSMSAQQLTGLTQRRIRLSQFLGTLRGVAEQQILEEGGTPVMPAVPNFSLPQNTSYQQVQQSCVTTRVLAELAADSGISVSDEFINHYLTEWGLRKMGNNEIGALLGRFSLTEKTLFSGIRELLLGNFYINSFGSVTAGVMPEERWQDWRRINERISVEAAILPTEDFLADVPEPDEAALQSFYEEYKDQINGLNQRVQGAQLPSPDPGFREPRRVRLQYLLGDVNEWAQKYLDGVTEEEISDYYERNKRTQFVKTQSDSTSDTLFDDEDEGTEDTTEEAAEAPPEASAEESATEETTAVEEAATEQQESATPAAEDSGQTQRTSPFRLTAYESEEEEDAEEDDEQTESEEAATTEEAEGETAADSTSDEAPVEFVPLDEVSDQIRRQLATEKAVVGLKKVVDQTFSGLRSDYNSYGLAVVTAREAEKETPAPPAELSDYIALAKESGLAHEATGKLSGLDMIDTAVGKARDAQSRREFVGQKVFRDLELYEPYLAQDLDGNWYIVCKTEDLESRVPPLDEVQANVIAAWKRREAAKLALTKAEELAAKAKESGDTVAVVSRSAGYKVVTTDMYSWLTFGTTPAEMQRGPRLGEAPPLKSVGMDFMRETFELEPDAKIAVQNHDLSQTYVVQLSKRDQTQEELHQRFLAEANTWFGGRVMGANRANNSQQQLITQLTDRVGLEFESLDDFWSNQQQ